MQIAHTAEVDLVEAVDPRALLGMAAGEQADLADTAADAGTRPSAALDFLVGGSRG